jgi:hypothetical protein
MSCNPAVFLYLNEKPAPRQQIKGRATGIFDF